MAQPAGYPSQPAPPGQQMQTGYAGAPQPEYHAVPPAGTPPQQAMMDAHAKPTMPGKWSSGICGCFSDMISCCVTCCFHPATHGILVQNLKPGENWIMHCLIYWITEYCCLNVCLWGPSRRSALREKYGLPEEPCNDCCLECWCAPCAMCQEWRELKARGVKIDF